MKELKITNQFKKDIRRYQNQPKRINKPKIESDTLLIWFDLQISPQHLFQRLLQNGSGAADVHSGEAFAFGAEGGAFYEAETRFPDKKFG